MFYINQMMVHSVGMEIIKMVRKTLRLYRFREKEQRLKEKFYIQEKKIIFAI